MKEKKILLSDVPLGNADMSSIDIFKDKFAIYVAFSIRFFESLDKLNATAFQFHLKHHGLGDVDI